MSLALKRIRKAAVRKGMVVVHKTDSPPIGRYLIRTVDSPSQFSAASRRFEAQVLIL